MNKNLDKHNKKTRFTSEKQPANPGRKKKIYTIIKENGYSKEDMMTCFNELAWYSYDELGKLFKDENAPVIVKVIASCYKNAVNKGDFGFIKQIIEYNLGKPIQTTDLNLSGNIGQLPPLDPKEAKRISDELENEC